MNAQGMSLLDELRAAKAEPDPEAVKALMILTEASYLVGKMNDPEREGYVRGFLMEHPELGKAFTARKLVERVAHGFTGFISDVADYALTVRRPT